MDWESIENDLTVLKERYTCDSIRNITFLTKIFPLVVRFERGERSENLYNLIKELVKQLGRM